MSNKGRYHIKNLVIISVLILLILALGVSGPRCNPADPMPTIPPYPSTPAPTTPTTPEPGTPATPPLLLPERAEPSPTTTPPESTTSPPSPTETDEEPIIVTEEGEGLGILMVIPQKNFNDTQLFTPKEFFEGKGAEVTVASTSTDTARGMFGKTIKPDLAISDVNIDLYDAFVIVGGNGSKEYLWENNILITLVQSAYERDKVVSAICLSSVVLARAGILEGIQATVFQDPEAIGELNTYDAIYVNEKVVVSDRVITGRGTESSSEFALKIWDVLITENPTE